MRITAQRLQGAFGIDVDIAGSAQGITALYGPSGAGKTSILNMVAGLLLPDSGKITLGEHCLFDSSRGICLAPEYRHVGYVFQEGRLFPHLSVRANLLYGRRPKGTGGIDADFDQVVDLLGIGALLQRRPKNLSGGEKQRVALGRALLSSPRLLLMDEPLASLDSDRKQELLPFIRRLNAEFHIPVLYVSHVMAEIEVLADTVVALAGGKVAGQRANGE